MSNFAKISIRILADLSQFSSQMQNVNRDLSKMGKKMQSVGKGLSVGLTAPLLGIGTVAVKTFADFEQALAKVSAVSGATGPQMQALRNNAEDLGASTRFAASEVAELQLNLSKLGFKPDEILATTEAVLNLALASGSDLAQSAIVAASTIRGFGIEVSESGRVADVMAKSFSSSALDLEKFSTAMGTLAPVAKNANVSLEQATSFLSILVDRGVDATTAGTGLRNMFLDLAGTGQTLNGALDQIRNSTNKNKTAFDLFGKRGATVAAIMADNSEEARGLEIAYLNSAGAAKAMADIMDNTLEGSFFRLKSATESASIALGEELAPYIRKVAENLAGLVAKFKDLSPETKKIIVAVGAFAAVLGPLLITLGFLMTTVIPGLITAFAFLGGTALPAVSAAMASLNVIILANPIGAIAAAVALLVYGFTDLVQSITPAVSKLDTFFNLLKSGGNQMIFNSLQLESQVKGMREAAAATDKAGLSLEEYNKRLKEAPALFEAVNGFSLDEVTKPKAAVVPPVAPVIPDAKKKEPLDLGLLEAQIELQDTRAAFALLQEDIAKSGGTVEIAIQDAGFENLQNKMADAKDAFLTFNDELDPLVKDFQKNFIDVSQAINGAFEGAVENAANFFGEFLAGLATGSMGIKDLFQGLLGVVADFLGTLGKSLIAAGVASEAFKSLFASGVGAIAAGAALVALSAVVKTVLSGGLGGGNNGGGRTAFANGGIVYGPTNALIGEYSGAKNNPEVVAPLNKLKDLLGGSGSGKLDITLKGVLKGTDMHLQAARTNHYLNRRG